MRSKQTDKETREPLSGKRRRAMQRQPGKARDLIQPQRGRHGKERRQLNYFTAAARRGRGR